MPCPKRLFRFFVVSVALTLGTVHFSLHFPYTKSGLTTNTNYQGYRPVYECV